MKDNNRRDWSIGLSIVIYAMNICCSRPTHHTLYELVFGQHPLCYFNMIEEWKQHNVNMKENLPEGIIENKKNFEENRVSDPEDEEYNVSLDHRSLMTTSSSSSRSSKNNHSMLRRTIFDNQQARQFTRDNSDREQINDKNTEMFSKPISQQDIQGVQGQMENQMHAKYNIYKHIYKVGDLVKIQIVKIDCRPDNHYALLCKNAFSAGEVLLLKSKEFPELNNSPTDTTISIIEAAKL
ncbi:19108_t:CDS:2 [Cetraspora pellucida]|uniref:19108_t:CDS:1 n=1 Tax=Cetraspora pellucida TaxID=1433469 RepID=A0A9N9JIJ0_9GLOM|nr:19108_t:CDS:2 [Cetraspora pellucida]